MAERTVGCLQLTFPDGETRRERIGRVSELILAAPDADLLVLPELWDVGFFDFDRFDIEAEALATGPVATIAPLARRRRCTIVAGSVLERDGARLHNTIPVIDRDGDVVARYRKRHLFRYRSREGELLSPGSEAVVAHTAVGRLGLATCFDLRFGDHFRSLRERGADAFVVPAAWPLARVEHWRVLVQARAIEWQTPTVAVNGVGPCYGTDLAGSSLVIDAVGRVAADAGDAAGWFTAAFDPEVTEEWRRDFPLEEGVTVG